jgi:hypothetical protein
MADIEEACARSYGLVLVQNTTILYGHFPAAEFDEARSENFMLFMEWGAF